MNPEIKTPAGLIRRSVAWLIDLVILGMLNWFILYVLKSIFIHDDTHTFSPLIIHSLSIITFAIYYIYFLASKWQGTIGKHVLNVYVVNAEDGMAISRKRAFKRYLIFDIPNIIFMLVVVFFSSPSPMNDISKNDQQRFSEISEKMRYNMPLTKEEEQIKNKVTIYLGNPELSNEEKDKLVAAMTKSSLNEPMTSEEENLLRDNINNMMKNFVSKYINILLPNLYYLLLAITIFSTREKKAFHDIICKTRVLYGKPHKTEVL